MLLVRWQGKTAEHWVCLDLFVTFSFKRKSKEEKLITNPFKTKPLQAILHFIHIAKNYSSSFLPLIHVICQRKAPEKV
jgi:hypothetical protein